VYRVRTGKLAITPGYDGIYGKVRLFSEEDRAEFTHSKLI
jgi:PHP family Zn ribbon phosphoesterase